MAGRTPHQRIGHALAQLLERLLPTYADDDDASAEQRFDDAFRYAVDGVSGDREPAVASDVNHASDLIKKKLIRENSSPEKALRFANLYSRLLTQPVLNQKWAMLYFLYRLSDTEPSFSLDEEAAAAATADDDDDDDDAATSLPGPSSSSTHHAHHPAPARHDAPGRSSRAATRTPDRAPRSPALDDAFSTAGLRRLPDRPGSSRALASRRPAAERAPRPAERRRAPAPAAAAAASAGKRRAGADEDGADDGADADTEAEPGAAAAATAQQDEKEEEAEAEAEAAAPRPMEPSEPALLRDLPFTLQGLSSTHLRFGAGPAAGARRTAAAKEEQAEAPASRALRLPETVPVPVVSLLHALAEPALLYRGLAEFVEGGDGGGGGGREKEKGRVKDAGGGGGGSGGGLVGQSFRSALGTELRAYLGLVAALEGQIRRALAMIEDGGGGREAVGKAGVTLKRCVVWTREATMGLRLMSLMVEEAKGKKGGQLISLIHSFSLSHGDPFVGAFAERLLSHITQPFYNMLRQWVYDGELSDPYQEFFVSEQHGETSSSSDQTGGKGGATSVWADKYMLNQAMTPTIVTDEFANKVFLIGKTLNFIRYGCSDAAWVESYSKAASHELHYGDTASLERSIDEAYQTTMARLISLMDERFKLFAHLRALKKYLLLGAGDFIAVLMESLSSNLDRPANTQYRHTLTAQLEHAVRNSNAQHDDPDVLRRLDSRMLELSHGEIGWDVFTLEYKIDAPVDVIVTPYGSKQYLKVFNFLWRVKRVEFALGSTWRRYMTGARGVLRYVEDAVGADWRRARAAIAEMIHFVANLQHYILFEVIEKSWDELQRAMRRPDATLDHLIAAHGVYLRDITRKGLLSSGGGGSGGGGNGGGGGGGGVGAGGISAVAGAADFTAQLHELLKIMLAYRDAVEGLYSVSMAESLRRQNRAAKIELRTAAGKWGVSDKDDGAAGPTDTPEREAGAADLLPAEPRTNKRGPRRDMDSPLPGAVRGDDDDDDMLPALRARMAHLAGDFKVRVNVLLGDLAAQPDQDMKWLSMMMNFNDVYAPVRRKKGGAQQHHHHHHHGGHGGHGKGEKRRRGEEGKGLEQGQGQGQGQETAKAGVGVESERERSGTDREKDGEKTMGHGEGAKAKANGEGEKDKRAEARRKRDKEAMLRELARREKMMAEKEKTMAEKEKTTGAQGSDR
ncbi:Spc98 family-domain-containing protein [Lineolata rhizophorae]|uniref:Spc98 family-domain-containing protein n=1 Tax=Lineolata rhizophorae TaxID=578093 RepID=A0A6A6P492_9PEZI|nr:Spc98 family-domain-containing protein [Lineolata rhizophorae]